MASEFQIINVASFWAKLINTPVAAQVQPPYAYNFNPEKRGNITLLKLNS